MEIIFLAFAEDLNIINFQFSDVFLFCYNTTNALITRSIFEMANH